MKIVKLIYKYFIADDVSAMKTTFALYVKVYVESRMLITVFNTIITHNK